MVYFCVRITLFREGTVDRIYLGRWGTHLSHVTFYKESKRWYPGIDVRKKKFWVRKQRSQGREEDRHSGSMRNDRST